MFAEKIHYIYINFKTFSSQGFIIKILHDMFTAKNT